MKNLRVWLFVWCWIVMPVPLWAQDTPPAVPLVDVAVEKLAPPATQPAHSEQTDAQNTQEIEKENNPTDEALKQSNQQAGSIVVELFTSQACVFCPKADMLLGELSHRTDLISLSCHVDYFDVKTGSLSHPYCGTRQAAYEGTLRAGPKYTPQIVINGRYDAIGYKAEDVMNIIARAKADFLPLALTISPDQGKNTFVLNLPQTGENYENVKVWLMVFDKPHKVVVADGGNKGKEMTYYNVISNAGLLGNWDGQAQSLRFDPKLQEDSAGFVILAQEEKTGHILATGQFRSP